MKIEIGTYIKVYREGLVKAEMALQNCLPLLQMVYASPSLLPTRILQPFKYNKCFS